MTAVPLHPLPSQYANWSNWVLPPVLCCLQQQVEVASSSHVPAVHTYLHARARATREMTLVLGMNTRAIASFESAKQIQFAYAATQYCIALTQALDQCNVPCPSKLRWIGAFTTNAAEFASWTCERLLWQYNALCLGLVLLFVQLRTDVPHVLHRLNSEATRQATQRALNKPVSVLLNVLLKREGPDAAAIIGLQNLGLLPRHWVLTSIGKLIVIARAHRDLLRICTPTTVVQDVCRFVLHQDPLTDVSECTSAALLRNYTAIAQRGFAVSAVLLDEMKSAQNAGLYVRDPVYALILRYVTQAACIFNLMRLTLYGTYGCEATADTEPLVGQIIHFCKRQIALAREAPAFKLMSRDPVYLKQVATNEAAANSSTTNNNKQARVVQGGDAQALLPHALSAHDWSTDILLRVSCLAEFNDHDFYAADVWSARALMRLEQFTSNVYPEDTNRAVEFPELKVAADSFGGGGDSADDSKDVGDADSTLSITADEPAVIFAHVVIEALNLRTQ